VVTSAYGVCGINEGQINCSDTGAREIEHPLEGQYVAVVSAFEELTMGCGLTEEGTLDCWRRDEPWQPELPAKVTDLAGGRALCALLQDGSVACFDANGPKSSPAGNDFVRVSASFSHACALRAGGQALCWGFDGALPRDPASPEEPMSSTSSTSALAVPDATFSAVSAGDDFTCGILADDGSVMCWGAYSEANPYANVPEGSFSALSCGTHLSCGLRETGEVRCWGRWSWAPTSSDFVAVEVTGDTACALRVDGHFECNFPVP
jgi:hypothetical protein